MKTFAYKITDPMGLHARPAGLLVKAVSAYKSDITILKDDKKANPKSIFSIMGLSVKHDDTISMIVEGIDEEIAVSDLEKFFCENL